MSSNNNKVPENTTPSVPIPIASRQGRGRSMSVSSASSGSMSSGSELPTPPSGSVGSQRISIPSPSTSPILSYFLANSPSTKTPASGTFPFKRTFGTAPVLEEEPAEREIPAALHARRASATFSNRFSQAPPSTTIPEAHVERGTNLLRRLSLSSSAFVKPQFDTGAHGRSPPSPPPNSASSPTMQSAPFQTKPRRSATISVDGAKPRRAPSPMGERILKGHFDGFN